MKKTQMADVAEGAALAFDERMRNTVEWEQDDARDA